MKVVCDTSILVEIDRHSASVVALLQQLAEKQEELIISTVTVTEILTGAYLRRDAQAAVPKARDVLNQFSWRDIDGQLADAAAKLNAFLIGEGKMIEFPDILIAATALVERADALLTLNRKDFLVFPNLKDMVRTPAEFVAKG